MKSPNIYGNFLHGHLWRQKSQQFYEAGEIVLPFSWYIDDAEVKNPLGPHASPVTFIYYSFPMFKDSEVFLAATVQGTDYKACVLIVPNYLAISLIMRKILKLMICV